MAGKALRAGEAPADHQPPRRLRGGGARDPGAYRGARGRCRIPRAVCAEYGIVDSNDLNEMVDMAAAFTVMGNRLARRQARCGRVVIRRRRRMGGGCLARPPA